MKIQGGQFAKVWQAVLVSLFCLAGFFYFQFCLAAELININTASLTELDSLPGIGPAKAQAIIDYRTATPFTKIEDIKNVSGIGDSIFNDIKNLITVSEFNPPVETHITAPDNNINVPASAGNKIYPGDIVINEFVSDPADGDEEWIELYNVTASEIDLSGLKITEGSGSETKLSGAIEAYGFFLVKKIAGNLNNSGDIIILSNKDSLIDQIAYGNWNDGNTKDNAPAVTDPNSVARVGEEFFLTSMPTPNANNIIKNEDSDKNVPTSNEKNIIISEIFPDPEGSDEDNEWIEIYNKGKEIVNLSGWILKNSKQEYALKSLDLKAGEYAVFYRKESKLALNNYGDTIKLFSPDSEQAEQTIKFGKAQPGWSYALKSGKSFVWTKIITPGKANIIKETNHAPEVNFNYEETNTRTYLFDSSDSIDEDGDKMNFTWNFDDRTILRIPNPEHTFKTDGKYTIKLEVSDGQATSTQEEIIQIGNEGEKENNLTPLATNENSGLMINEIFPNPSGSDVLEEWIELKNSSTNKINLLNWKITDQSGTKYEFKKDNLIEPGGFYVLKRTESGVSLNNTEEIISLSNPAGEAADQLSYSETNENEFYARGQNGNFFWAKVGTPGAENIITVSAAASNEAPKNTKEKKFIDIELSELKNLKAGDLIKTSGNVTALPGALGTQYFYIGNESGAQIYSFKKDFPKLAIGDLIEVKGELSVINNEPRIKTKTADEIKVISHGETVEPEVVSIGELSEEYLCRLVQVSGQVTQKKGSLIYVDDGEGETEVYLKKSAGISSDNILVGGEINMIGIVSGSKNGIRISPRSADDIQIQNLNAENAQVLGEIESSGNWNLEPRNKKKELIKYLGIICLFTGLLCTGILIRKKFAGRKL